MSPFLPNAYAEMVLQLEALDAPAMNGALATPEELEAMSLHLKEVARIVDAYVVMCGREAKSGVTGPFDVTLFHGVMLNSLEGNATYELFREAERIRQTRSGRRPRLVVSR